MGFTRDIIDETIANGFSNKKYRAQYEFYFHILAQCKVIISTDIETAGVRFANTKYILMINPEFFDPLPLTIRLGILKHEMLHILYNHTSRQEDRQQKQFNIAADCAINQQIDRSHITDGAIYPDILEKELKERGHNINFPLDLNAEQYYDLLPIDPDGEGGEGEPCAGEGEGDSNFYDGLWKDNPLDNHESWNDSEGDEDLKRELTKRMIEKGIEKSRGNTPYNISELLDIWSRKPQVSWKKVLQNIASNKKAKKVSTIMKKSRRFPKRPEIRGHKKDRDFNIVVVLDVSGSMSNDEIITGLNEIKAVANLTSSKVKIIQVDTEVKEVEDFEPRKFKRSGAGGTEMAPAWQYIKEKKIPMDCAILISDMYIEDIKYWSENGYAPRCKTIFLATEDRMPDLSGHPNYIGFKLEQA